MDIQPLKPLQHSMLDFLIVFNLFLTLTQGNNIMKNIHQYLSFMNCGHTRDFIFAIQNKQNELSDEILFDIIQSKELEQLDRSILKGLFNYLSDDIFSADSECYVPEGEFAKDNVNMLMKYVQHLFMNKGLPSNPMIDFKNAIINGEKSINIMKVFVSVLNANFDDLQLDTFNAFPVLTSIQRFIDEQYYIDGQEFAVYSSMLKEINEHISNLLSLGE